MFWIGGFRGILEERGRPVRPKIRPKLQIKKCRKIRISEDARWRRYEPIRGNHSLHHHDRRASFYDHPPDYKRVRRSEGEGVLTYVCIRAVCILMRFKESRPSGRRSRRPSKKSWITDIIQLALMSLRACCAFQNVIGRSRLSFFFLETMRMSPPAMRGYVAETICRND